MSATGYNDMLEKYRDVDEDEIMSGMTKDELARLENEIDREILEKPPEYDSCGSESYTTATTSSDDSESEEESAQPEIIEEEPTRPEPRPRTSSRGKPEAFARGKLDKTQLKPIQKTLQRQKSKDKHTFKLPALKKTGGLKGDKGIPGEEGNNALKDELLQAVKKRDKRRVRRGNSTGIARRNSCGINKARRNSRVARYRDGNEHQVDAAAVNRNFVTDEMLSLRPRLRKVQVKEPKLVLPEELHGVSFNRITAGAKRKEDENDEIEDDVDEDPEPAISEDGNASRNSNFGYDADIDVTPSDDSCLPGEDMDMDEVSRNKAMSESSEAPSDGVATMASTASTSAESCDVFGELSINPNSVEEMIERVKENDPTLTEVNLNNIHDVPIERFEELAEAMEDNIHVSTLSLANTGLTDRAAKAIATMLKRNKTLKKLNVESNFITGEGGRRIVSALRKNNCLVELSIDNQRHIFGAKVEHEISKMLRENASLLKFGYQFANPGPRMATSNILTKNMDLVRKKRVAEEKQRKQAGLSKRPQLRRQPSSEWYRKERVERLKRLQQQSKMLGLDPSKGIGEKEVEKVLKNMNPDEVSLLERWFTSKLLGMVDKPPTAQDEDSGKERNTDDAKAVKDTKDKTDSSNEKSDSNLLKPPTRSRRAKSPPPSRDDLLDSIRNHNKKLKKVQLRPFESPTRLGNTDSDAEIQPMTRTKAPEKPKGNELRKDTNNTGSENALRTKSPPSSAGTETNAHKLETATKSSPTLKTGHTTSTLSTDEGAPSSKEEGFKFIQQGNARDTLVAKPTIVKTEPSFDATHEEPKSIRDVISDVSNADEMYTASEADSGSRKSEDNTRDDDIQERSSPEIREWKEGEEYDSDEYEVVEIEVTDSEEEENEDAESKNLKEEPQRPVSRDTGYPSTSSSGRESASSKLSERLDRNRPPPFSSNSDGPRSPAVLKSYGSRERVTSPGLVKSPIAARRSNPISPLSPLSTRKTPASPLCNRSLSRSSNVSTDSAKSSPKFTKPSPSTRRAGRSQTADDQPQINPKALSTIESFFSFK